MEVNGLPTKLLCILASSFFYSWYTIISINGENLPKTLIYEIYNYFNMPSGKYTSIIFNANCQFISFFSYKWLCKD